MKNVSCFPLSIERSRAPKKMGIFIFPLQGEFAGGIIAHSLAGIGKVVKKTKAQIQKITTRNSPMAGSTGSSISLQLPVPQTREQGLQSLSSQDVYSVRFINHAPEPLQSPSYFQSGRIATNLQPSNGYALKKSSGKSNFLLGSNRNNIFLQPTSMKWCQSRSKRCHCMYESPGCRSP